MSRCLALLYRLYLRYWTSTSLETSLDTSLDIGCLQPSISWYPAGDGVRSRQPQAVVAPERLRTEAGF